MYLFDQISGKLRPGNGTALCSAVLAVEGVSPYYSPSSGRVVWRYRSAEMLSKAADLYNHTVVLSDHPHALADSYPRDLVVGAVVRSRWDEDERGVIGEMLIHDFPVVSENGFFSHGVLADCVATPGTWRGIPYDEVIQITGVNHIASTSTPRQGDQVRLLMDSVAGEYAVDPTSLVIALPRTEAPTVIDTPPVPDEKPMTTETIVAPELVPDPRIDDLIALVTGLGASLSTIAQEVEALKTAPPAETTEEEPTEDPLVTASLQEALGLQKVALEVGVPSEDLVSPEGRATIVGAIETAVGLTDSWDPTGLSIQQRTLVCQTIHRMATKQAPKEPVLPTTIQDSARSPRQTHPVVLPEVTVPRTTPTLLIR